MTRVYVYEYLTAAGIGRTPGKAQHHMHREGRAMRDALADDFARLPGVEVVVADCLPLKVIRANMRTACGGGAGRVCLIAPETELIGLRKWAHAAGLFVIGCTADAVVLSGSKLDLSRVWEQSGVPTPRTLAFREWEHDPIPYPVVLKPELGAGSVSTYLVKSHGGMRAALEYAEMSGDGESTTIVQQFVPGRPASIAFLIGERETIPLLPTFQRLSADGLFRYLGGELPIRPDLADRAVLLGRRAVGCVPGLFGYVGVDLILGDAEDGSGDYAIEINPRLTTSYVGLRALADFNLAEAMLNLADGRPPPEVRWKPGRVRFDPGGAIDYDPTPGAVFE